MSSSGSSNILASLGVAVIVGAASGYFAAKQLTMQPGAGSPATSVNEERVSEIVKDYIYNNPKDIIEALQQWQVREESTRIRDQAKAVEKLKSHFDENHHYGIAGNPDGDVTIVEFFDYNCPACKMMFETLDSLIKVDDKVRVVFVEYPIFGPQSDMNARIATAVATIAPDKYYDFHTAMIRSKGKIDADQAYQIAQNLEIDIDKLKQQVDSPESMEMLTKDRQLGQELKIQGTPAVIIGNQIINSALPLDDMKAQVRWARVPKKDPNKPEEKAE